MISREREKELESQGWTRRFVAEEPRLSEAVELYRSLGMEVLLESVDPTELRQEGQCQICLERSCDKLKVIYTRPSSAEDPKGRRESY